jgi:hypothetical protein
LLLLLSLAAARRARCGLFGLSSQVYLWLFMALLSWVVSWAGRQPGETRGAATLCTFDNACSVFPALPGPGCSQQLAG